MQQMQCFVAGFGLFDPNGSNSLPEFLKSINVNVINDDIYERADSNFDERIEFSAGN